MSEVVTHQNLSEALTSSLRNTAFSTEAASRQSAAEAFTMVGLPGNKTEEYRFTPITRSLERNFTLNHFIQDTPSGLADISGCLIPDLDANLLVFINGQWSERFSKIISPKDELSIESLTDALGNKSGWAVSRFTKCVDPQSDPFAALNTALWRSGVAIRIPDNKSVLRPLVIHHIHDASLEPVAAFSRLLIDLGANSSLSLVEKSDSFGSYPVFSSVVEEIHIGTSAKLSYCKIQQDAGQLHQVINTQIHQEDASRADTWTVTLGGQLVRNNFRIAIDGEGCESHFYGLYLLNKNNLADNHTVVDHRKPNSFSNQLYKGIMDGNSKGVFNGKIYVRPHAQKTNAFQSNRNILLTDTATINTKPQLEIWADDVKCSHGCTSGQLDEEALFYLRSRGISGSTAQAMLLSAFAGEILTTLQDASLKKYLEHLLSERLHQKSDL